MDWLKWENGKVRFDFDALDKWIEDGKEITRSERLQLEVDYLESHERGLRVDIEDLKQQVADLEAQLATALQELEIAKGKL